MLNRLASACQIGKCRRLNRLVNEKSGRTLIVPIDDSLIFGPFDGLHDLTSLVGAISEGKPNGILCFTGAAKIIALNRAKIDIILNLTASTVNSFHTTKIAVFPVDLALTMDAAAVAVHVNITDDEEPNMIRTLGRVSAEANRLGLPVLGIMYPRRRIDGKDYNYHAERDADPEKYARLVSHCCRVAFELGVDIIKTTFVPNRRLFENVVKAVDPIPVIIAGGELNPAQAALSMAAEALEGGAKGISFGRNVFNREKPGEMVSALRALVHENATLKEAKEIYTGND